MKKLLALCLFVAASLILNAAVLSTGFAHGTAKPQHGGVTQMMGETVFELVALGDGADVYLSEEGEALDSNGMSGKLTVTTGAGKSEAALTPAGGNKLTAKGVKVASGAKVGIMIVRKDQSRLNASFSIK
jgi:hypothetical protein